MDESINRQIVWPDKPTLREELYKLKPASSDVRLPLERPPIVSSEVVDEAYELRIAQALGEVAAKEAIA